jgi:hypothetical protein
LRAQRTVFFFFFSAHHQQSGHTSPVLVRGAKSKQSSWPIRDSTSLRVETEIACIDVSTKKKKKKKVLDGKSKLRCAVHRKKRTSNDANAIAINVRLRWWRRKEIARARARRRRSARIAHAG